MKKLISAASALAMAATMVSSVVPFATGAADATKGFELRAFQNKAGETVSTTISEDAIKAGDVTIPIGLYYVEGTPDTLSLTAQVTANTKDVSFNIVNAGAEYFDSVKSYTLSDGSSGDTNTLVGFSGTIKYNKKKDVNIFAMSADATTSAQDEGYAYANVDTPWASVVWNQPVGDAYKYSGDKSDDYPLFVLEATFKKGTAAGTYTIDFLDFYDLKNTDISTTMVDAGEGKGTRYSTKNKNIDLKGIEITIGGSGDSQPTTASTTASTSATTASTTATTATTAKPDDGDQIEIPDVEVMDNFVITCGEYTAKPGDDIEVECKVESGGHMVASFLAELDKLPAGITATMDDDLIYCLDEDKSYSKQGNTYQAMVVDSKTQDPVSVIDGQSIINFTFHVPENAANGTYDFDFRQFQVVESSNDPIILFLAKTIPGKITIEGGTDTQPTTASTTASTSATTASTTESKTTASTTASTTAKPGTKLWGDTNCNGVVNIADVVVLNKYLADSEKNPITDQGKINADCCDAKDGKGLDKNDSQAIIQSIVHLVTLDCKSSDLK